MPKTSDVLAAHAAKTADHTDPKNLEELIEYVGDSTKFSDIVVVFREAWFVSGIPGPIRHCGSKEAGQFRLIANWMMQEPEAEGVTVSRLVGMCVAEWDGFRAHVAQATGWKVEKVSPTPDVGLLLFRKEHALAFCKENAHAHAHKMAIPNDFLG